MLKPLGGDTSHGIVVAQPPSGSCVLKQQCLLAPPAHDVPAAFRRLCVETGRYLVKQARHDYQPPSGGCVLKPSFPTAVCFAALQPPSGGCVLKPVRF